MVRARYIIDYLNVYLDFLMRNLVSESGFLLDRQDYCNTDLRKDDYLLLARHFQTLQCLTCYRFGIEVKPI